MSKTWSITEERTIVKRVVVEGATEEEALENWAEYKWLDSEDVDEYDREVTGVEEDIPDMTWDEYAQQCRDNGDPTYGTVDGEPVSQEEWEQTA